MSDVTIDKLSIDIESNSTNASSGIDGLAKALKNLKKNSDISNAVTNLNELRKSLHAFVNMPSSASKIESLANSMAKLKKVGKIDIGNSLASVKKSMESLGAIDVDGVAPQIERIAGALQPLNNVKGNGLNAMMNGLKKLDEVVDGLDSGSIDRFVEKIKELDEKLTPVSKKLVAIGNAFKGVNTSAGQAADRGLKSFRTNINATAMNLTNFVSVAQSAVAALQPIIRLLTTTIGDALEWDGIEYQFGNSFGEQADEYYEKITEITDALNISKQTFMEMSAMSTSMLKGFGVNSADARTMGLGYTELAYDIWAAYNNKYKTLKEASDAISSAIAGEVEPIRRAGFTIVDSQLKITAANHGLTYSTEKATEAQKSYLRYLTLVDQAHEKGIVGAYASEMDTAEGTIREFRQQLTVLSQTFGSVFLPILVTVVPWLTAFVELLGDAIIAIANLFGVDIQKVDFSDSIGGITDGSDEAADSVNNTTEALKELKNATIGIDELNVISPPTAKPNSGAGAGGTGWDGIDVESLWDKSIYDQVKDQVDTIKEKIKGMLPVIGGIATAFAGWKISKLLDDVDGLPWKLGKLTPTIKNLAKGLAIAGISIAVGKLVWDFTGAYLENGNLGDLAKMLGTTVLGAAVAAWLKGPVGAGLVLATSGVVTLGRLIFDVSEGKVDISDPQSLVTGLVGSLETILGGTLLVDALRGGKWTKAIGTAVTDGLTKVFGGTSFAAIGTALKTKLLTALSGIGATLGVSAGWAAAIIAAVVGVIILAIVDYDFTEIGRKIGEKVGKAARVLVDWGKEIGGYIKEAFNLAVEWVKKELEGKNPLETILFFILELPMKGLVKVGEIGADIVEGIFVGIGEGLKNLWGNIKEFCDGLIQGFKDGFEIKSPSKKMIAIGKEIIAGLVQPLTPSAIKDKISSMWTNAKNWWNKSKGTMSAYVPSIGDIKAKVSSAWTTAKNWWDKSKSALSSYTPSIGSIKDKLLSAWNTAKAWWTKNVKLSIPSLSFKVTYDTSGLGTIKKAIVNALNLPGWPKLSFAKDGGMFDMGSLIWAGEAGAEVVANAGGGRTGVMNVQQMQEAVYEGVYSAVVAAMRSSGGNGGAQSVNVYLDGKKVTQSVEKHQRERGVSFVGRQAYIY